MDHRVKAGGDEGERHGGDERQSAACASIKRENSIMPAWRNKRWDAGNFTKRRSIEEGRVLADAAHIATHRLYCDALAFWRSCSKRTCKRHRRCTGEPTGCLMRGLPFVPQAQRLKAQEEVIAGGPRRIPPATHLEGSVRRTELATLVKWGFG
jgi:hypothetical protein